MARLPYTADAYEAGDSMLGARAPRALRQRRASPRSEAMGLSDAGAIAATSLASVGKAIAALAPTPVKATLSVTPTVVSVSKPVAPTLTAPAAPSLTPTPSTVGPPAGYTQSIMAASNAALAAQPPTFLGASVSGDERLKPGMSITTGQWFGTDKMRSGVFKGNWIILDQVNRKVLWSTAVPNTPASVSDHIAKITMGTDGNFSAYDAAGNYLWGSSWAGKTFPNGYLELLSDGNLVLYDANGDAKQDFKSGYDTKAPRSRFAGPPAGYTQNIMAASNAALAAQPPTFTGDPLSSNGTLRRDVPMLPGQWIGSAKIRFGLYQGNVILLDQVNRKVLWTTKTATPAVVADHIAKFMVRPDGIFAAYDAAGATLWTTPGARGSYPNGWLEVHDDANVVAYDNAGQAWWDLKKGFDTTEPKSFQAPPPASYTANVTAASNAAVAKMAADVAAGPKSLGNKLTAGQSIVENQQLVSPNGRARAVLSHGRFYVMRDSTEIWAWGTGNATHADMQADSNFVVYDRFNKPIAASDTTKYSGCYLVLEDDGNNCNLLVRDGGGSPKWDIYSGTATAGGALGAISSAATSIGNAFVSVGKVAYSIVRPMGELMLSPVYIASDIAQGKNVFAALKDSVKKDIANATALAPYAQAVLSVVPGVGQGVSAAIGAGAALAQGASITDALVAGVAGLAPGGPLVQSAIKAAYQIAKGGNVLVSVLEQARANIPGGAAAQAAFDVGLALAHGQNLQEALKGSATNLVKTEITKLASPAINLVSSNASDALATLSSAASKVVTVATPIINQAKAVTTMATNTLAEAPKALALSNPLAALDVKPTATISTAAPSVQMIAQGLAQNPSFRSLTISEVASQFHATDVTAKDGVAAFVGSIATQAQAGAKSLQIVPHPEISSKLSLAMTVDQALAQFASAAAKPVNSPGLATAPKTVTTATKTSPALTSITFRALSDANLTYLRRRAPEINKLPAAKVAAAKNPTSSSEAKGFDAGAFAAHVVRTNGQRVPQQRTVQRRAPMRRAGNDAGAFETEPTIKQGSTGTAVVHLQTALGITADGKFGPATATALKAFQQKKGLVVDGIAGPKTWAALSLSQASAPGQTGPTPTIVAPIANVTKATVDIAPAQNTTAPLPVASAPKPEPLPAGVTSVTTPSGGTVYRLPEVTIEASPDMSIASPHILQAQMLLAGWAADNKVNYGTLSDLNGLEDARFHVTLKAFQSNKNVGNKIGNLDGPTYDALLAYVANQTVENVAVAAATLPGMPGPDPVALPGMSAPAPTANTPTASPAPSTPGPNVPVGGSDEKPTLPGMPGPNPTVMPEMVITASPPKKDDNSVAILIGLALAAAAAAMS